MRCDASGVQNASDIQGRPRPEPGTYLVACKTCDDSRVRVKDSKSTPFNATVFSFEVLAGNVPGQEGKDFDDLVWLGKDDGAETPEYIQKMLRRALSLKILRPGECRDVSFDQEAPGKICVIALEKYTSKKDGKDYTQVGNFGLDVWPVDDPAVASVMQLPAAQEVLRALGWIYQPQPQAQPQAQPPVQQAAPVASAPPPAAAVQAPTAAPAPVAPQQPPAAAPTQPAASPADKWADL